MIPKTKLLEWIEDYCLDSLNQTERNDFETELERDNELRDELEFEKTLQSAITEKDVLNLRTKLQTIAEKSEKDSTPFQILDGFDNFQQLSDTLSPDELLNFYDSLPKAHIYQHEMVSNENIHEFYREQNTTKSEDELFSDEFDDIEFDELGLEEAILEKDIINLRETLSKVSSSVREQFSAEEVDAYINGELTGQEFERFQQELSVNKNLQREVKLHLEMESAILEPDIMELRSELKRLTSTQTSWNVTQEQIEDFINGDLIGEELDSFLVEFNENSDLKAEVALHKNIEKSIGEKDIFILRDKLGQVKQNLESREIRSIVPDAGIHDIKWWRAGVAIAVILIAFTGFLNNYIGNYGRAYDEYFQAPQWAPHRTVSADMDVLQKANHFFNEGEYEKALILYNQAINNKEEKFVFQFYKASTLHQLGRYEEAIPEYSQVVEHGDNIFVEEAEWFKTLCYLKLDKKEEAKTHLTAIIERNGYFASEAKAILRKTKYSLK